MSNSYHLLASCPDQGGIVAKVAGLIAKHGGCIREAIQHTCQASQWFFMRYDIDADSLTISFDELQQQFEPLASSLQMQYRWFDASKPKKLAIFVSRQDHCLRDLLYRYQSESLPCDIACVISNHKKLQDYVEWFQIPYHHVEIDQPNKQQAFKAIFDLVEQYQIDSVALARFMQIIPEHFCNAYAGRIINIHHSFLPSFSGSKPYQQAFDSGVKLVGATCHYVTAALDQGPIIEQDIIRISHTDTATTLARKGRDVEKNVLARGLRYHLENRVISHNNKTVVFI